MVLRRTSAQALSSPMPFIVPLQPTCSRCLSPPYHIPFRFRRWRSRCFAAADGRVGFAAPGHATPNRVAVAALRAANATALQRKKLTSVRQCLLPLGSSCCSSSRGGYSPYWSGGYRQC